MMFARRIGNTVIGWRAAHVAVLGIALFLMTVALPGTARAVNTCNGQLAIDYVSGPQFAVPGDILRVRLTIGTASSHRTNSRNASTA